ncbi:MAG TPA: cytochrome c-type biogenesis protein CcmH [Solirubrobacteraceae bacterium]|nr:cytochrome c-type biogenesis protein CcmH [Solirubrobacteraceae bacterium]
MRAASRGGASLALAALAAAVLAVSLPSDAAASARTSQPAIERQVMCVTCKIPLNVAESPQADREKAFIRGLIERGETEKQIKDALVAQYGQTVLGLPSGHGFDLTAYLVPLAVVVALAALLVVMLPRWRRRAPAGAAEAPPPQQLSQHDSERLESDLARFD